MSEPELVHVEGGDLVATITLNRPEKLNALSSALERQLLTAVEGDVVRSSRAVVLTGAGRAFSAGADINEFTEATPASILSYYRELGGVYERVAALPQPTIAAVHGYCLGGGFELALACDFRVAEATALFGLPEVSIGILPSSGGTQRLARIVGPAGTKELMLLRDRVSAADALRLGAITEVVEEGRALERAREIAVRLAELPPLAVEVAKRAADAAAESSREAGLLIERLAYATLSQTDDAQEAATAFVEKRDPKFTGR